MKRNSAPFTSHHSTRPQRLGMKTIVHEAGHAAAIHLGNQQRRLPPVYFQIVINGCEGKPQQRGDAAGRQARIEGGRLIQSLPPALHVAGGMLPTAERQNYLHALEADIVNLLVGPLAEAKYIALSDDEPINPRFVNLDSLYNYGGTSDLHSAQQLLKYLLAEGVQHEQKMFELFLAAYRFIDHRANWTAITHLADYLLTCGKNIIGCEEAIAILDAQPAY